MLATQAINYSIFILAPILIHQIQLIRHTNDNHNDDCVDYHN